MKETELEQLIRSYNERMSTKQLLEDVIEKIVKEISVSSKKVSMEEALKATDKMLDGREKRELFSQLIKRWKMSI